MLIKISIFRISLFAWRLFPRAKQIDKAKRNNVAGFRRRCHKVDQELFLSSALRSRLR